MIPMNNEFKEDFLPIPNAPNYEINSQLIVRRKSDGLILKQFIPKDRKSITVRFIGKNGKYTKGTVESLRRQAEVAVKIYQSEVWLPIPSLNYLYEISQQGICRNVRTKRLLKLHGCWYCFSLEGQKIARSIHNLLWEVHGIVWKNPRLPVAVTLIKGLEKYSFPSFRQAAKFLESREHYSQSHIIKFFCNLRADDVFGWKIIYHENPDDMSNIKTPKLRVVVKNN